MIRNFVLLRVGVGSPLDQTGTGKLLGLAENNYFASTAWLKSAAEYDQIVGRSFGLITADDNNSYKEDKGNISLPTLEELQMCWDHPKTSESFKIAVEKRLKCSFQDFIIASKLLTEN